MGLTVEQLNKKYGAEDQYWNFNLFPQWLKKHGIDDNVIELTLQQVLLEWDVSNLPDKHHDFDRGILALAENNKGKIESRIGQLTEQLLQDSIRKHLKGNRFKKAFKALMGEL